MAIGFIGFGEAAQAFAGSLREILPDDIIAYDIRGAELASAADALNVRLVTPEKLAGAGLLFSSVTAAVSLDAVQAIARHIHAGQTLIDINSVSPARKQATANVVAAMGAGYVDMAVMGPVLPKGHKTPVLVAGASPELSDWLAAQHFDFEAVGDLIGNATAIKMVRSLFVKGLESITVAALTAAEKSGCHDAVLASLAKSFPGLGWPEFADYERERVSKHGARRAAEMRECAVAMQDLGLPEARDLALAVARVQETYAKT